MYQIYQPNTPKSHIKSINKAMNKTIIETKAVLFDFSCIFSVFSSFSFAYSIQSLAFYKCISTSSRSSPQCLTRAANSKKSSCNSLTLCSNFRIFSYLFQIATTSFLIVLCALVSYFEVQSSFIFYSSWIISSISSSSRSGLATETSLLSFSLTFSLNSI